MRSIALTIGLLSWLAGCRASPPEPAIAPSTNRASRVEPAEPQCLLDSWRPALHVPPHADPSFEPKTGLLADGIRLGPIYPAAEGAPFPDVQPTDDPALPYYVSVLDYPEDRGRVFLLCEESGHRIGFWQATEDLRPTNRSPVLVVALPPIPESFDDTTPGIRLPAGAAEIEPGYASMVRAVYDGYDIHAEGFISATAVDVVFESETPMPEPRLVDGVLVGSEIVVYDAPDGAFFALVHSPGTWVRKLDASPGFVLVRFTNGDTTVVGWIRVSSFEARPARIESARRKGGGGGSGYWGPNLTHLEPGTLLVHEPSELVVGVITEAGEFWCPPPCEEPAPRIGIVACEYEFELRAVRPATSTRLCPN